MQSSIILQAPATFSYALMLLLIGEIKGGEGGRNYAFALYHLFFFLLLSGENFKKSPLSFINDATRMLSPSHFPTSKPFFYLIFIQSGKVNKLCYIFLTFRNNGKILL